METIVVLGILLSIYQTPDGMAYFLQEVPAKEYATVEECFADAKEINSSTDPYVLYCAPALDQAELNRGQQT